MSENDEEKAIENAAQVIEKFGGIRPMSAKIGVAVTTIQGWKKRDTIPANRRNAVIEAAKEHGVDLSGLIEDAPVANEDARENSDSKIDLESESEIPEEKVDASQVDEDTSEDVAEAVSHSNEKPTDLSVEDEGEAKGKEKETVADEGLKAKRNDEFVKPNRPAANQDFTEIAVSTERRAITKSTLIAAAMVILVVGAIIALAWPKYEEYDAHGNRLSRLEGEVSDIRQKQTAFKGLVPENWAEQLDSLKKQMGEAQKAVEKTVGQAQEISSDFVNQEGIEQRVAQLQSYVSEITKNSTIPELVSRFDSMRETPKGSEMINYTLAALQSYYSREEDVSAEDVNQELDNARKKNTILSQTFSNVPKEELQAAAMLLAMTQVRSALSRNDSDFEGDLALMKSMVGEDSTDLQQAIDKLSPYTKEGILTPGGLRQEFQGVAGDVVVASLKGEDVSLSERMSAKMNEILKVEKDGEMITGSDAQKTIDKADKLLEQNMYEETMELLTTQLDAKELDPLRPWLKELEAVLAAENMKRAIKQFIELHSGRGYLGGEQLLQEGR